MVSSKTATFTLREVVSLTAVDTIVQGSLDIGSYISVADSEAFAIEHVDCIWQSYDTANDAYNWNIAGAVAGNAAIGFQLTDQNPNTEFVRGDSTSLIASGSWYFDDANTIASQGPDLFPDNFGKLDQSYYVVNDNLYFNAVLSQSALAANRNLVGTIVIRGRIVKLDKKAWIAKAISSTSND
jgi:hypothetical protein